MASLFRKRPSLLAVAVALTLSVDVGVLWGLSLMLTTGLWLVLFLPVALVLAVLSGALLMAVGISTGKIL